MKKALANTRVSVKLRKSEYREEWYLYVEAYPVFQADKPTPQRVREYLNRTITTPIWDKSRNARTDKDGKTTYKPKRDLNGGKSSVSCPLKPSDSAPLKHSTMPP